MPGSGSRLHACVRGRHPTPPCGLPMQFVCAVTMHRRTWVMSLESVYGRATPCG